MWLELTADGYNRPFLVNMDHVERVVPRVEGGSALCFPEGVMYPVTAAYEDLARVLAVANPPQARQAAPNLVMDAR